MPNGTHATASKTVTRGLASRIRNFGNTNHPITPRGPKTSRAQEAKLRSNLKKISKAAARGERGLASFRGYKAPSAAQVKRSVARLGMGSTMKNIPRR